MIAPWQEEVVVDAFLVVETYADEKEIGKKIHDLEQDRERLERFLRSHSDWDDVSVYIKKEKKARCKFCGHEENWYGGNSIECCDSAILAFRNLHIETFEKSGGAE